MFRAGCADRVWNDEPKAVQGCVLAGGLELGPLVLRDPSRPPQMRYRISPTTALCSLRLWPFGDKSGNAPRYPLREGLCEQEIESPSVTHGAVLQNRPAPRATMLEELRIQCQRLAERGDGLLIFFFAEVGIGKVLWRTAMSLRIVIAF